MKYENAKDVLPKELFDEVQKHAAGRLLYFPIAGKRRPWGERTGIRSLNRMRNEEIRARFRDGVSVDQYDLRMLLQSVMTDAGFRPLASEWWHFTLRQEPYPDTYFNFPVERASLTGSRS